MNTATPSLPGPFSVDVITRSDHAPTNHERYGDWARKFYGNGFHEMFKDTDTPVIHTLAFGQPAGVLH